MIPLATTVHPGSRCSPARTRLRAPAIPTGNCWQRVSTIEGCGALRTVTTSTMRWRMAVRFGWRLPPLARATLFRTQVASLRSHRPRVPLTGNSSSRRAHRACRVYRVLLDCKDLKAHRERQVPQAHQVHRGPVLLRQSPQMFPYFFRHLLLDPCLRHSKLENSCPMNRSPSRTLRLRCKRRPILCVHRRSCA